MISYEVAISVIIITLVLYAQSLNFEKILEKQFLTIIFLAPLLINAITFFIAALAETNRSPFDLPEAEAELVAGYNVEYSAIMFAMFFLAEYSNMILMATIFTIFFTFSDKFLLMIIFILIICFMFILVRATFPRYRYDQLMEIG